MSEVNGSTDFDLEDVYDGQIEPLMKRIIEVCKAHNMPMIASFNFGREGVRNEFCTTFIGGPRESPAEFKAALQMIKSGFAALAITTSGKPEVVH